MTFPDAKDDDQRETTRAFMKSLRYTGKSTHDASSVAELCEAIVGEMRESYHKDERPDGTLAWLSADRMIALARQSSDSDSYFMLAHSLARAIQVELRPLLNESRLGSLQVSLKQHGYMWRVEISFL